MTFNKPVQLQRNTIAMSLYSHTESESVEFLCTHTHPTSPLGISHFSQKATTENLVNIKIL